MAAVLVAIGAGLFLFLGLAHAVFTFQSSPEGGPMMPTDPATRAAMQTTGGLGLAPEIRTTLHRAWIGFNLSHSLGVIVVAAIVLANAVVDLGAAVDEPWFLAVAAVVPPAYLVLAQRYWFDQPRNAIAVGTVLVWAGLAIELL